MCAHCPANSYWLAFHAWNKTASSAISAMLGFPWGHKLTAKVLSPTLVVMSPSMVPYSTSLGLRRSWLRLLNFRRATPNKQARRHITNTTDRIMRPTSKWKFCVAGKDFPGDGGKKGNGSKDHCLLITHNQYLTSTSCLILTTEPPKPQC